MIQLTHQVDSTTPNDNSLTAADNNEITNHVMSEDTHTAKQPITVTVPPIDTITVKCTSGKTNKKKSGLEDQKQGRSKSKRVEMALRNMYRKAKVYRNLITQTARGRKSKTPASQSTTEKQDSQPSQSDEISHIVTSQKGKNGQNSYQVVW